MAGDIPAMFVVIFAFTTTTCTQNICLHHKHTKCPLMYYNYQSICNVIKAKVKRIIMYVGSRCYIHSFLLMQPPYLVVRLFTTPFFSCTPHARTDFEHTHTHTHTVFVLSLLACSPPFSDTFPYSYTWLWVLTTYTLPRLLDYHTHSVSVW